MSWQGIIILCIACIAGNVIARKPRIVNGKDAYIKDFPYMASLRHNNEHICGGAIISEKHVITAAQCITNKVIRSLSIVTGTSYRKQKGNSHNIASVAVHPNYSYDGKRILNDIAVITLKDVIIFDNKQQKINLPEHNFKVGDVASVTGWGSIQRLPVVHSKKLQVIKTNISSKEVCQKKVLNPRWMIIDDTVVCTVPKNEAGTCLGDAGSPLVVNGELVGIVSWVAGLFCATGFPEVYTNVYKYKDFINSVVN